MELKGAKAIVTGGDGGYGFGIARALLEAGAEVWITGRNAAKLAEAAQRLGARAHAVQADASVPADWDRLFAEVGEDVALLVNNAGFGGAIVEVADQRDENIASVVATNLTGVIYGSSRAAARMRARRAGLIVNISSVCARYAWPGWSVYSAAKAGLSAFSRGLYAELRPYGVRVACVTPSWGQTDFNAAAGIRGAAESPDTASWCISPEEMGRLVRGIAETPDHLAVSELTVLPMIQEIVPM